MVQKMWEMRKEGRKEGKWGGRKRVRKEGRKEGCVNEFDAIVMLFLFKNNSVNDVTLFQRDKCLYSLF